MGPTREYGGISRRSAVALGAAAVALVVVALAALGSRAIDVPEGQVARRDEVLARFASGGGIVLAVGVAVVAAIVLAARRNERVARACGGAGPWRTGRFVGRAAPWVIAAAALGAVLGAAAAPLHPRQEDATAPSPGDPRTGGASGRPTDGRAPVFEGAVVRDRLGRNQIAIDRDGDGQLDATLVPCPARADGANTVPPRTSDGATLVPIDNNCDGTIDGYARLRSLTPMDPGDAPLDGLRGGANEGPAPVSPATPASPDRSGGTERLTGGSSAGRILLFVGIGVAAVALAVIAARLLRGSAPAEVDDDAEAERGAEPLSMDAPLEVLHRAPDPRTGIIEAYGQLLVTLARAGHARYPHEAPEEYLRRCAASLQVRPAPMATLTELFAVARFSTHALTEAHLRTAIDALVAVDADLASSRAATPLGVS